MVDNRETRDERRVSMKRAMSSVSHKTGHGAHYILKRSSLGLGPGQADGANGAGPVQRVHRLACTSLTNRPMMPPNLCRRWCTTTPTDSALAVARIIDFGGISHESGHPHATHMQAVWLAPHLHTWRCTPAADLCHRCRQPALGYSTTICCCEYVCFCTIKLWWPLRCG